MWWNYFICVAACRKTVLMQMLWEPDFLLPACVCVLQVTSLCYIWTYKVCKLTWCSESKLNKVLQHLHHFYCHIESEVWWAVYLSSCSRVYSNHICKANHCSQRFNHLRSVRAESIKLHCALPPDITCLTFRDISARCVKSKQKKKTQLGQNRAVFWFTGECVRRKMTFDIKPKRQCA